MVGMVGVLSGPFVVGRSSTNAPGVSGISGASVARRGVVERGLRPPARPRASARRSVAGVIVKSQTVKQSSRSFAKSVEWRKAASSSSRERERSGPYRETIRIGARVLSCRISRRISAASRYNKHEGASTSCARTASISANSCGATLTPTRISDSDDGDQ